MLRMTWIYSLLNQTLIYLCNVNYNIIYCQTIKAVVGERNNGGQGWLSYNREYYPKWFYILASYSTIHMSVIQMNVLD